MENKLASWVKNDAANSGWAYSSLIDTDCCMFNTAKISLCWKTLQPTSENQSFFLLLLRIQYDTHNTMKNIITSSKFMFEFN